MRISKEDKLKLKEVTEKYGDVISKQVRGLLIQGYSYNLAINKVIYK